uniref:Uncharacterized protein n=1 Tax=Anguilla anguilla TaxID=7936 RepID=A0A0E9PCB9_ANGAN
MVSHEMIRRLRCIKIHEQNAISSVQHSIVTIQSKYKVSYVIAIGFLHLMAPHVPIC